MDHGDVMMALLGASAGLAGLLLVFLGFVVSASGDLDDDVPLTVHNSLQRTALVLLAEFAIGLSSVALTTAWLVTGPRDDAMYDAAVSLFALQLLGLGFATAYTVRGLLWAGHRKRDMLSRQPQQTDPDPSS